MQQKKSHSLRLQQNLITAVSFSRSDQFCAIATKRDSRLLIFRVKQISAINTWQLVQQFHDQSQPISEIDWAKDDKIISGSHDRSIFIYKRTGQLWQKMLANIDIKLSILCAKWAPNTKKFAIGAACSTIGIGFYNVEASCWTIISRSNICKSPVISLSFHPSSNIFAIGSTDNSIKILSCNLRNSKDEFVIKSNVEDNSYQGPFSNIDSSFQVLFSIEDVGGWVNHISFELNGSFLLVLPHSNHLKLFDILENGGKISTKQIDVKWNGLPFLSGFLSDKGVLYAGGFDKKVAVFNRSSSGFSFANFLQTNQKSSKQKQSRGLVSNMLQGLEKKSVTMHIEGVNPADHVNPIKILPSPGRKFVVAWDVNGVVHFWM